MRPEQEEQPIPVQEQRIRKEESFPKDPQERLGRILNAVNIGPKAATLLLLHDYPPPDRYISPEDLRDHFQTDITHGTEAERFDEAPRLKPWYLLSTASQQMLLR